MEIDLIAEVKKIEQNTEAMIQNAEKEGQLQLDTARNNTKIFLNEAKKSLKLEASKKIEASKNEAEAKAYKMEVETKKIIEQLNNVDIKKKATAMQLILEKLTNLLKEK